MSRPTSWYDDQQDHSAGAGTFVVPIDSGQQRERPTQQQQHHPHHQPHQQLRQGTVPSAQQHHPAHPPLSTAPSTHNYRHSAMVEQGDYHSASLSAVAGPGAYSSQNSMDEGQYAPPRRMHGSVGQLFGGSTPGAQAPVAGRPNSMSGMGMLGSPGGSGGQAAGQRMAYSPAMQDTLPTANTWGAQDFQQQQYRVPKDPAANPPPPPQAGAMRRGMSIDTVSNYATPSVLQDQPQLQALRLHQHQQQQTQLTPQSSSLLPTSYSGRTPTNSYAPSSIDYNRSPAQSSHSLGSSHTFAQPPNPSTAKPPTLPSMNVDRNASYSPSQYAAQSAAPLLPPLSATSAYNSPSNPSSASFYAQHIPVASAQPAAAGASAYPPPSPSHTPAFQPQAQLYYQSQQYFDSTIAGSSASASAPPSSTTALHAAQYYAGGQVPRSASTPGQGGSSGATSGQTKGFRRVRDTREIKRTVRIQPAGRRADPAGGFISPLKALTTHLPQTYQLVNPTFRYETSLNPRRVLTKPSKPASNEGFDNEDSDYILYVNDVLGPAEKDRYLILDVLGQGTFGQVVKCQNLKTHEIVAVKVVKNKPAYFQQSMMEVTILELINNQWDKDDEHHMLRLKDTFIHHSHLCLVFELLSNNLYELIKQNSFRGLSTSLVRVFTAQLLDALTVLQEAKIIHCDLKPENILLKSLQSPTIKVIDFGSACHEKQTVYTYIQSRFYRSPEVILSLPYSVSIDMWSLGCICVELFLGLPLFPGTSEYNQITRITDMLGSPPEHMLESGKQTKHFFDSSVDEYGRKRWRLKPIDRYSAEFKLQEQPSKKYFTAATLPEIIKQYPIVRKGLNEADVEKEMKNRVAFIDFVQGLLHLDPERRWSPQQARLHPFVLGDPLLQPFVPPPHLKSGTTAARTAVPASPQTDPKRPYGGLPPAPQRSATRTYQDAKAYNQHLTQQQGYTVQAQQAAQRAAQVPTNPYHLADVPSAQSSYAAGRIQGQQQQQQQDQQQLHHQQQQQQQHQQQQLQQQQQAYGAGSFNYPSQQRPPPGQPPMATSLANPPAVYHTTTRGRSNTITQVQDLPPALQKLGHDLAHSGTGQSVTPVLRRDDQWQAWERIQSGGDGGAQRRVSISRNPHLNLLQEQAENGMNSWQSPMRAKQGQQSAYSSGSYYQSPIQGQQQFSVVVDGREQRQPDLFDAGITAPPQAYSSAPNRYMGSSQAPGQYDVVFDGYDRAYIPPQQQAGLGRRPSQHAAPPSFYSSSLPTTTFPGPTQGGESWPR